MKENERNLSRDDPYRKINADLSNQLRHINIYIISYNKPELYQYRTRWLKGAYDVQGEPKGTS